MPIVVPNILDERPFPAAAWSDAATIVLWALYRRFGNAAILVDQFASMRAWVDTVAAVAGPPRLHDTGLQFG